MKKAFLTTVAALSVVGFLTASAIEADARSRSGAVAAGVIGGLAAGAIIGSAMSRPSYAAPVYVAPQRRCWAERERWSPRRQAYVVERVRVAC